MRQQLWSRVGVLPKDTLPQSLTPMDAATLLHNAHSSNLSNRYSTLALALLINVYQRRVVLTLLPIICLEGNH